MATVNTLLIRGFRHSADSACLASDHDIDLPSGPPLGARAHGLIAASLVAVVCYASLFPFHFESRSFSAAAGRVEMGFRYQPIEPGDFIANILLFVPLGYFLLGTLRVSRAGGSLLATTIALGAAFALSVTVEIVQAFFPPRMPCLNDVLAQVLGASVGMLAWECCGRRLTARFRSAWTSGDLRGHVGILLACYVCMLIAATLLPFDLEWRTDVIGGKLSGAIARALEFDVAPFGMAAYLWNLCLFAPAGVLAAFVTRRAGPRGEGRRAFLLGAAVVLLAAAANLAVRGKRFDAFSLPVELIAFGMGWLQGRSMRRSWHRSADSAAPRGVIAAVGLGVAWCVIATTLLHGQPLDFTDNPTVLLNRMGAMNWLPLNDVYGDNYLRLLQKVLRESMLFLIGGAALALGARNLLGKRGTMPALAVAFAVALILETGQLNPSSLQPSVTAVLWQATAAWLSFVVVRGLLPAMAANHATRSLAPVAKASAERSRAAAGSLQPV